MSQLPAGFQQRRDFCVADGTEPCSFLMRELAIFEKQ
jgi:hypothetical protein